MNTLQNTIEGTAREVTESYSIDASRGGFDTRVSSQWWSRPDDEKFLSLSDLEAHCLKTWQSSQTHTVQNRAIEFIPSDDVSDRLTLKAGLPNGDTADFTHWSFSQAGQLAGFPASHLRKLPAQLAADCLTWCIRRNREVEEVKTYYRPGNDLRAITGPTYGRIPDYEVVQAVRRIAGNGTGDSPWKVPGMIEWGAQGGTRYNPFVDVTKDTTTLYASDRDVFMFLCDDTHPIEIGRLPNGDPDLVFRGFAVSNSEVGKTSLKIMTWYLRGICQNRCFWGVENFSEINIRHSSGAPDRFIEEARPALESYTRGEAMNVVKGVEAAKAARVADDDEKAAEFLTRRKFAKSTVKAILQAVEDEEGHKARSAWDMAQGITAVARKMAHQDSRMDMEREAGRILDKVA